MLLNILSSEMHKEKLDLPFELDPAFLKSHQVVAVLTGGTESKFVHLVEDGLIDLHRPVYLMVSGHSNSLAASLEILSYIRQHKGVGKVMMSADDTEIPEVAETASLTAAPTDALLHNDQPLRLGVVGKPSDWLISSGVDYKEVLKRMNIELVDIDIEEMQSIGIVHPGMPGAEAIYQRLKELVVKNNLQGVTLRCFDLLTTVKNTGCIALSKLNDEGIPASCEGDIPTLLTMMLCKKITGEPCFQVNPARIQANGEMLFAHCTLPLKMTEKHEYTTHFESGIGVAIHGELPTGDYTLVKMSGDMQRLLAVDVELERCQFEANLCRTQVWIKATPEVSQYFLTAPIHNHHILIRGHHAAEFRK
jgi:L-fucose isomerase-like protein